MCTQLVHGYSCIWILLTDCILESYAAYVTMVYAYSSDRTPLWNPDFTAFEQSAPPDWSSGPGCGACVRSELA